MLGEAEDSLTQLRKALNVYKYQVKENICYSIYLLPHVNLCQAQNWPPLKIYLLLLPWVHLPAELLRHREACVYGKQQMLLVQWIWQAWNLCASTYLLSVYKQRWSWVSQTYMWGPSYTLKQSLTTLGQTFSCHVQTLSSVPCIFIISLFIWTWSEPIWYVSQGRVPKGKLAMICCNCGLKINTIQKKTERPGFLAVGDKHIFKMQGWQALLYARCYIHIYEKQLKYTL